MKNELETLFEKGKNIHLSQKEKSDMKASLISYAQNHPIRSIESALPWYMYFQSHIAVTAFTLLVFMTGGSSVVAEKSFPGDALYGVKTGVNEQVLGLFAVSSQSKAQWQVTLADRRLQEVEHVALNQNNAEETKNALIAQIDQHIKSATEQSEQDTESEASDIQNINDIRPDTATQKKSSEIETVEAPALFMATMAVSSEPTPSSPVRATEIVLDEVDTGEKKIVDAFEKVQSAQEKVRQVIESKESKKVKIQAEIELVKARRTFFELKDRENKQTLVDISKIVDQEIQYLETLSESIIETGDRE